LIKSKDEHYMYLAREDRNASTALVRRPEGKRPLGRRRCRLEDNIKMDLKGTVYGLDSSWLGQSDSELL